MKPQLPGIDRPKRNPPRIMAKLVDAGADHVDALLKQAREDALREAAEVADSIALPMDGKREKAQATYMRNVIRHNILALIEKTNPGS